MLKPSGFTTLADAPPLPISPYSGKERPPEAKVPRDWQDGSRKFQFHQGSTTINDRRKARPSRGAFKQIDFKIKGLILLVPPAGFEPATP